VQGHEALPYRGWYMVTCNHQSWADIFVLQRVFNRRIPLLKFFLKRELIYVPVIGLAWWALDFPFMRRQADAGHQDLEATRRACAKFALVPTSVMNFVEGTRFTPTKHAAQGAQWQHLLAPKAGGMAAALEALGERFDSLLDVTIVYPDGVPGFWDFLCGRVPRVVVRMQRRPIPADCRETGPAQRRHVQRWLRELWHEKDRQIGSLLHPAEATR
jgi:1-acyl-sn-glycerol-3-phosphate acyltransferase